MIEEWDITQTNLGRTSKRRYEVAVLPTSAIEPHNRHLPHGIDFLESTWISREACKKAWEKAQSILCLPGLPYGVDCNLLSFPLAIHVSQSTLDLMIREIVASCRHHGIRKILILNAHGGNCFTPLVRQIQCDTDVHVFTCNWWLVAQDRYKDIFMQPDDHAGTMETSVAMALCPDLVEMQNAANGTPKPFRFEALQKKWVTTSRDFSRLNANCAAGDPANSSAERGQKFLEVVVERIAQFLVELAQSPIDKQFPHMTE